MQTLLRHFITALGGALLVDTSNTQSLVFGLVAIGCAWLSSLIQKLRWIVDEDGIMISDTHKELLKKMLAALVSQGLAALSGWMMANGFDANPNDPAAVMLFLGNYGISRMGWYQKPLGIQAVKALALCALLPALSACTTADMKAEAITFGKRVALSGGDIAVAMARAELDKRIDEWIKAEESGDVFKIMLAAAAKENAQAALDAAQRALNKQRAKLDAKQPINVQPQAGSKFQVSSFKSPPLQGSKAQSLSIPIYAPQVVASLSEAR